jgi:hypothetical protein
MRENSTRINGGGHGRLHESTGTSDLAEAERYLIRRMEELRKTSVYGIRIERTFRQAATKFLLYFQHKRSIGRYAQSLKILDPCIGDLPLRQVHQGTLEIGSYGWARTTDPSIMNRAGNL